MKKKILIIGNNDGLPGVQVDINNYLNFFTSAKGGNWVEQIEVIVKLNPFKKDLIREIEILKNLGLDYLIVIYSGHAGQERETMLEINSHGEKISESELKYIAERQLNIFDCCRSYPKSFHENLRKEALSRAFSGISTREKYEKRILQAIPQQVSLYSCSVGETSNDTPEGGVYSKFLIQSSKNIFNEFKLVGTAHVEAYQMTLENNKSLPPRYHQHPEAILPRCESSQQLIISISSNNSL